MIYFADFMIHTLLKDLFLARNYILLKQRKGSLKKNKKSVTYVILWGGGLEWVHVTQKNHSLKIIFKKQF